MTATPAKPGTSLEQCIQEELNIVRQESNLLLIGYFGAHDPRGEPVTRREIPVGTVDGVRAPGKVVLEAPPRLGVPSTVDREKWYAFSNIFMDRLAKTGLVQNPIRFTMPEFLHELGRTKSIELYNKVQEWGERLAQTSIVSRGIIYRKSLRAFIDTTEHVFRKFSIIRPIGQKGRGAAIMLEVTLEDWVLDNMNQRYVVREDLNAYRRLKGNTAKGIFDLLHIWFNASKGQPIERSYQLICQRLNVPQYAYKSKIKSTMGKALDELVSIGYLRSWSFMRMSSQEGFKFGMVAGSELLRVLKITEKALHDSHSGAATENRVVEELVAFGVTREKAAELSKLGGEEEMLDRIEYINSLIYRKKDSNDPVDNPAGFVIRLLENGIKVPSTFVTSRQRESILAAQRKEREAQEEARLTELAYAQWIENRKREAVESRFTAEALEKKAKEKLPQFLRDYPYMRQFSREAKLKEAERIIEREIEDELALPSLDQWTEMDEFKNAQIDLF